MAQETDKFGFEIQTCGRCCGTGTFSYNRIHGKRCYGCGGTGKQYTKRGSAARKLYDESLQVEIVSLKIGDLVQVEDMSRRYFATVTKVREYRVREDRIDIEVATEHEKYGRNGFIKPPFCKVRKGFSADEKKERVAAALAYQASLTTTGKPRKSVT